MGVKDVASILSNIGGLALSVYGFLSFAMSQYETFIMDKSMLKKLYGEIKDDDPSSAVSDFMTNSD